MKYKIIGYYLRNEIRTGGHRRYLELLSSLSDSGYEVNVYMSDTIKSEQFSFNTIKVKPVNKGKIPYTFKQLIRMLPIFMKLPKDKYLSISFGESNLLIMKLIKFLLKGRNLFAFRSNSYTARLNQYKYYNKKLTLGMKLQLLKMRNIERSVLRTADLVLFQTDFDCNDILSRNSKVNVQSIIIPNSINEKWFLKEYKGINESYSLKSILYLGSFDDRKGVLVLLKGINEIVKKGHNIRLKVHGYGSQKSDLVKYVELNNLADYISINDKISNPLPTISNYDLVVIPSIYDSYPNVILESIFVGTPVIGSNNSGIKSILQYNELLFETGDCNDLAKLIEKMIIDKNYYSKCKDLCSQRLIKHDFNWPNKFIEAIKSIEEKEK